MRWDFGKIYKDIRKSKGLSQEQVCGQVVARSTLANFERGTSVPNFETMVFFLDQLNMSIEEFRYICHEYHPSERQGILYTLYNLPPYPKLADFEQLLDRCQTYLHSHHDVPIKNYSELLSVYIHLYHGDKPTTSPELRELTTHIWESLAKQDTWYESDLRMLKSILYYFSIDTIDIFSERLLDSLQKYKDYRNIKALQIALLLHLSTIYLEANRLKECEKITLQVIELANQMKHYVYLAVGYTRLGICQNEEALIDRGLTLLELTDETELLESLREDVKKHR